MPCPLSMHMVLYFACSEIVFIFSLSRDVSRFIANLILKKNIFMVLIPSPVVRHYNLNIVVELKS